MIKLICVGNVKEKALESLINEYMKRIQKYNKLELIQLPDFSYSVKETVKAEGKLIMEHISNKDYVISLEIDGKALDSLEFAEKIRTTFITNNSVVFIVGGSYGLSEDVKMRSNYKISFSKMTFPHQLFRLILLEQIYRAFKIINNESYHK